ncbi:TPA: ATP-binding protein [Kluyvera ascorbata]|nr:ATP-binding protein [Kluyvera ascorbata]
MTDSNKYTERAELLAKRDRADAELNFALTGEPPYNWRTWAAGATVEYHCRDHGPYTLYTLQLDVAGRNRLVKHSGCPGCLRQQVLEVEETLRGNRVSDLLDVAHIARRFEHCELDNYEAVNADADVNRQACEAYANNWPKHLAAGTSMVMVGSCGTGKNHLAVGLAKKIIRDHLATVLITDVMRITRMVKSTWRNDASRTEADVLDHYTSLDLLIIDEVGVQFGSPSELAILQEVINSRYESMLPTILISNLTLKQLKDSVSERIVDRVTEGGNNQLVFNWESYRGNGSAAA